MKYTATIFLILILKNLSFGQTLKNFNGDYKHGKAKYQYYNDKQNEIVLHGKFAFSKKNEITESGEFKNNLKNGNWKYVFSKNDEYVKVNGKYENDLKEGIWSFSVKKNDIKKEYVLNFKKDILIGRIDINGLVGEFNGDGKYIGNWNTEYLDYSYTVNFIDNILISLSRKRLLNSTIVGNYNPDISRIDFLNLEDENNYIIRQTYNLEANIRTLVDEFEISKIYGVADYDENLHEKLFYLFFDAIESRIQESFSNNVSWTFLKQFQLINNPDFLYLIEKSKEIQEIKVSERKKFEKLYGPVSEYNKVDTKPLYVGENDNFIKFLSENYKNIGSVSGRIFIEFIIDKDGKLHVIKTNCSGNISCGEINRILEMSPNWQPGKQNGQLTNVRISYPIVFQKTKNQ